LVKWPITIQLNGSDRPIVKADYFGPTNYTSSFAEIRPCFSRSRDPIYVTPSRGTNLRHVSQDIWHNTYISRRGPPIVLTSYTVQKVARDMLLILTTRSFVGNARNVETSRSIKTTHGANLGISRIRAIFVDERRSQRERTLTIFAITRSTFARLAARCDVTLSSDVHPTGRKPLY